MSAEQYRVGIPGGRVAKKRPLEVDVMLRRIEVILSGYTGAWQIRRRGDSDWSGARDRETSLARLADLTVRGDVGGAWQLRPVGTPGAVFVVRKVEVAPPVASPSAGTDPLKEIHLAYFERFPDHESWGIFNCRPIAGSSSWSQHAWGNAEDFSDGGVAAAEAQRWFNENTSRLPIAEVIGRGRIWTKASQGFRALSPSANQHHDHWHVSADPLGDGSPPCAP